jgi:hypothetical protein
LQHGCRGVVILPVTSIQAPCIIARVLLLLKANDEDSEWTECFNSNIQVESFFILGPVGVVGIVTLYGLDYRGIDLGKG